MAGRYSEDRSDWVTTRSNDRRAWPLVITTLMLLGSFVPGLGLANYFLAVPMGLVLLTIWLSSHSATGKRWRDGVSWLFLIASCLIPIWVTVNGLLNGY